MQKRQVLFKKGNQQTLTFGVVLKTLGKNMFVILDTSDYSIHNKHEDQIIFNNEF